MVRKNGEKITIDDLAIIINKGFDGQMDYMKEEFGKIDGRFAKIEQEMATKTELGEVKKDVKYIKENLKDAAELEKEIDYIKNTLSIPALKK
jgi:uncharacterized coiled-coil DUF342 family protein